VVRNIPFNAEAPAKLGVLGDSAVKPLKPRTEKEISSPSQTAGSHGPIFLNSKRNSSESDSATPAEHSQTALRAIFLTVFIDLLGFGLVLPQLALYAKQFGAANWTIGILAGTFSLMQFLFAPLLGSFSDRYGRRPLLLVSVATSFAGYLLFALARSLPLLFLARIIDGIGGANIATAQAYIADVTTPETRARSMGMLGAAFGMGFILGPFLGGLLGAWGTTHLHHISGGHGGNFAIGSLAAALCLFNLLWIALKVPESLRGRSAGRHRRSPLSIIANAARIPGLRVVMAIFFIASFGFACLEGAFSNYIAELRLRTRPGPYVSLNRLPVEEQHAILKDVQKTTGSLLGFVGVLIVLMQGGLTRILVKRFGERRLVIAGLAILAAGLAILPYLGSHYGTAGLFLAQIPLAVGTGLHGPSLQSILSQLSPEGQLGQTFGLSQGLGSLARILGPAWGNLSLTFAIGLPFWSGAALLLVSFLLSFRLFSPAVEERLLTAKNAKHAKT
jgi:MFS family permease